MCENILKSDIINISSEGNFNRKSCNDTVNMLLFIKYVTIIERGVLMKNSLFIIEAILGALVIITIFMQPSKADALSGLVQGGNKETFFSKNKSRTKESLLVKFTVFFTILFAINTLILNIL